MLSSNNEDYSYAQQTQNDNSVNRSYSVNSSKNASAITTRDAPIIGIGRLSAVLPIIGIGRLLCRYRPIVVYAIGGDVKRSSNIRSFGFQLEFHQLKTRFT